jgi:glycosyltransferase involved in cell wall biosynthesis
MPRIAIVHEWLTTYSGSEKVLEQLMQVWPDADLFAVADFLPDEHRGFLQERIVRTTFVQRLPRARTHFRAYLPLMPLAIEQLDLSSYDIVLSSSHAVAKGVLTGPDQLHISYVHSPMRYAWDLQHQYLSESRLTRGVKGALARGMLHYLRLWDVRTANGVNVFATNSSFIARRVWKCYRRQSVVIHPPVDVDSFTLAKSKDDFYLTASRMVPYKKVPLIVEAFSRMPSKRLVVIGDGPEFKRAEALATSNISLLGYQQAEVLIDHMKRARAFIFAAEEDFGITPVEAQACGTPVIAFGKGGALETVIGAGEGRTGLFFREQTPEAICEALIEFENLPNFSAEACRRNAERFAPSVFRQRIRALVDQSWRDHCSKLAGGTPLSS